MSRNKAPRYNARNRGRERPPELPPSILPLSGRSIVSSLSAMLMNELDGHTITDPAPMEHPSMTPTAQRPYRGVFPVAPTIFDDRGELDLAGQRRCIDFMIDAGSNGLCILANFSEQFVLTDAERDQVMLAVLDHVAGRVPVIVTTTHFGSRICAERSRRAQDAGAAMVMVMPPYHGATFRVAEPSIYEFFKVVADAISIPIMIQDAPVAGTPLSVPFLARLAREIGNIRYFK